jgi:hypothetical protein
LSFDDAIRHEQRATEVANERASQERREAEQQHRSYDDVVQEFLTRMAAAGNPGLRQFKWPRGTPNSFAHDFLPARRVTGWSLKHMSGIVLSPEGRFFSRTSSDRPIILDEADAPHVFRHWGEGGGTGPFSIEDVTSVLAATLVEYGAA